MRHRNILPERADRVLEAALWLLAIAALVFTIVFPLVHEISGYDGWIHVNWLDQFARQCSAGNWYPRWMADSFSGYGSPAFYYYPPLAYYLGSFLWLCGIRSPFDLYNCLAFLGIVASGIAFYFYIRRHVSRTDALLGSVVYMLFPYRIIDLYYRSALTEHLSFVLFPLVFLALESMLTAAGTRDRLRFMLLAGSLLAVLLMTNVPMFLIVVVAAGVFTAVRSKRKVRDCIYASAAVAIALLLSAIYVLPALDLREAIDLGNLWIFMRGKAVLHSLGRITDGSNIPYGTAQLLTTLIGAAVLFIMLVYRRKLPQLFGELKLAPWIAVMVVAIVLQVPYISDPFYLLPGMKYIQLSYRWNGILAFAIAAGSIMLFAHAGKRYLQAVYIISMALSIALLAYLLRTNVMFSAEYSLAHGRSDPPEYLVPGMPDEPAYAHEFLKNIKDQLPMATSGFIDTIAGLEEVRQDEKRYHVEVADESVVQLPLQYFPLWTGERLDNHHELAVTRSRWGLAEVRLPAGKYDVRIYLKTAESEIIGGYLSLEGWLAAILAFVTLSLKQRTKDSSRRPAASS